MLIEKRRLIFVAILLLIAFPIIYLSTLLYRPVLSVIPVFGELEIQFYVLDVAIILSSFGGLYWLSKTAVFTKVFVDRRVISWKLLLPLMGTLQIILLKLFADTTFFDPIFRKNLSEMGIFSYNNLSAIVLVIIFLILFILLSLIVSTNLKVNSKIYYLFSLLFIIFLSFGVNSINSYDYAYFAGPINDLLHGKYLLYNAPSQYGFLSILILSLPFKFLTLNLFNLVMLNAIIVTLGFCLIFFLIQNIFRNRLFALLVIISIILFNYNVQMLTRGDFPQTNFLRFGWWVILGLVLVAKEKLNRKYSYSLVSLTLIVVTLSFFWVVDNGLYVLMAYLSYKVFNYLENGFKATVVYTTFLLAKTLGAIAVFFLITNLIYRVLNIPVNWNNYISDSQYYLRGFGLMPLPNVGWYWFVIIIYVFTLTYLFSAKRLAKNEALNISQKILSYVLFYGIFQMVYFMGRSHVNNLHHIIVPFLICGGFLIEKILLEIKYLKSNLGYKIYTLSSVILIILLPSYFTLVQAAVNFKNDNLFIAVGRIKNSQKIEEDNIQSIIGLKTLATLNQEFGEYIRSKGMTIVSEHDTWYLTQLEVANNINSNNLPYWVDEKSMLKLADEIKSRKDRYIFISKKTPNPNKGVQVISQALVDSYQFKQNIGSLDVWEYLPKATN